MTPLAMNQNDAAAMHAHRTGETLDLDYFVEWHTWLWKPAVRFVLGDLRRFAGRTVLELGCRDGKMASLFALLGANVTGLELPGQSLRAAELEARKWNVENRVQLRHYSGDLSVLPENEYDFVFSKSVLVVVPHLGGFAKSIAGILRPGGSLLAVENLHRGTALRRIRVQAAQLLSTGRFQKDPYAGFRGVTPAFLKTLGHSFDVVGYRESFRLVAAIEARKREGRLNVPSTPD
jgi:2-polyprenyl-3-methyl-5-hydroxy-6-metoxy-1,4-benzoquinol methylase